MQLWLVAAFASALFAGIVSILAKCGIKTIDSDVATALRTCVVAVFTWVMVAIAGSAGTIGGISPKSWLFLALSGLATGGSWICYFKALSVGDVNKVVPIDKSSTLMAVVLSIVLFNETGDLGLRLAGTALVAACGGGLSATSGRFCRRNRPQRPQAASVFPGRQCRYRTTAAKNRPEPRRPCQNRGLFAAKPYRSRHTKTRQGPLCGAASA